MDEKLKKYPSTKRFRIIDTIGVPHPYMITGRHVCHASDNFMGRLGKAAIEDGEKKGIVCGICKGELSFDEHKHALLVEVNDKRELNKVSGLKKYLLSIKDMAVADGFEGFAFKQAKS